MATLAATPVAIGVSSVIRSSPPSALVAGDLDGSSNGLTYTTSNKRPTRETRGSKTDVFNCRRAGGCGSNCVTCTGCNTPLLLQNQQSLQDGIHRQQDDGEESSKTTTATIVTDTSRLGRQSNVPVNRLHRNTLRSSSARQCITTNTIKSTTSNSDSSQLSIQTRARGISCGSSSRVVDTSSRLKVTPTTNSATQIGSLKHHTSRSRNLAFPSRQLQASSATTNSRVRQGALFARRQYHLNQSNSTSSTSRQRATITSLRLNPLVANNKTLSNITNTARIEKQQNKTADSCRQTTVVSLLHRPTSNQLLLAGKGRLQQVPATRGYSKTKSSLDKTSSKFSLASSTSSLSLAVVKRARPTPPTSQQESSANFTSCRYTSVYNRPRGSVGIASNKRAASVSSVASNSANYNSNRRSNNRIPSTSGGGEISSSYALSKQRVLRSNRDQNESGTRGNCVDSGCNRAIESGNRNNNNNDSTSLNLNQKPARTTNGESAKLSSPIHLLRREIGENNNPSDRQLDDTSCVDKQLERLQNCDQTDQYLTNKETISHSESVLIDDIAISKEDKQHGADPMKIHTRSPLGSANCDIVNTINTASNLNTSLDNDQQQKSTNINKDLNLFDGSIMISQENRQLLLDKKPVPALDIPILMDSICNYYDLELRPFARGKFAQVKRCINKTSKQCFAAKCIKKRRRLVDIRHEILLEIEALKLSYYTNHIVQLYEVFETPTEMILILEMANGGELQRVLDEEESIDEKIAKRMVSQILEGLVQLHDNDIAHLDIKPQNLLLTQDYPNGDIKLCDFGISRRITNDCEIREICGTPDYVAPEILRYDPISLATDMWSLGVLTYVMLSGYSPFGSENKQQTFCNITQAPLDFPSELFGKISNEAIDFMQKLIVREPTERLTSREAKNHTWLRL